MGMAIIRAIVDELDVREGEDGRGTVVHMTKYLDAQLAADARESSRSSPSSSVSACASDSATGSTRSSVVISKIRRAVPVGRTTRTSPFRASTSRTARTRIPSAVESRNDDRAEVDDDARLL